GRSVKSLLVVETDPAQRERMLELMDRVDIQCTTVTSGRDALQMLRERRIDCMVLNPRLPDMTAAVLAEEMQRDQAPDHLSVIVYASPDLSEEDTAGLKKLSDTFALRQVHSPERLLDQTAFFLHSPVAKLPVAKREMLEKLYQTDKVLSGKKVLIVDDD